MKIKELVEILSKMDQELEVKISRFLTSLEEPSLKIYEGSNEGMLIIE